MTESAGAPALTRPVVEAIAGLSDTASRTRFVLTHPSLVDVVVVQQLADRVRERVRVNVREAHAIAETAFLIAGRLGDDVAMAWALRARANAHWFLNDLTTAVRLFDEAASTFERTGHLAELGRTLSSSIQSLILLGDYERAHRATGRARDIFTTLGDEQRLARLDLNVGNILHRQDRLAEALECYERAYERLVAFRDVEGIGAALHNMAVVLTALNDFERAQSAYERARTHCDSEGMPLVVAQAEYNIADLHYFRGDYSRALDILRTVRVACGKIGDPYHAALATLDESKIYLDLGLSEEAAIMAQEAETEFDRLGNGYEAARALTNRAIALGQQGKVFQAVALFDQARSRFEQENNVVWPSVIDLYQALVLCNEGRFFDARQLASAALEHFRSIKLRRKAVLCELLLARIDLRTAEHVRALDRCESALDQLESLDAPVLDYQAHFLKGQIEEAIGSPNAAYASYQTARERLEALRSILWGEDLKIAFMTTKLEVYERLVDLCMDRDNGEGNAPEIFGYMEQAKSRSLRDLFFERAPMGTAPEGQSALAQQVRKLREELNWYYHRVESEQLRRDEGSTKRLETLQAQLQGREAALIRVLREMPSGQREAPHRQGEAAVASLQGIRAVMAPGVILIEYFRTADRILAAVLTENQLEIVPVTTVARVRQRLELLQFQLAKFLLPSEHTQRVAQWTLQATQAHLWELHTELLAPLNLPGGSHLVIVPHDLLHHVPFHALYDGERYVIDAHTVSYAPSAAIYRLCCQRQAGTAGRSLILGVPDERAPSILEEVQTVASMLPDPLLRIGDTATAAALSQLGSTSRIIHIATHGYFREDNPLFSGIRLGDSYLTAHDLYSLRLPADLIAVSGCGSGLNVVTAGDELRGLVRGLLSAGARSLLLALWDVHDRSTAAFVKSFYGSLRAGTNKALSVQNAMAAVRGEYPHPYHWAPFVLVGATS